MNIDHRPQDSNWSANFFGCGEDPSTCFVTCLLPCITFGQVAEMLDEGETSCMASAVGYGLLMIVQCHWLYSCIYREKLRGKFGLSEEPCNDCCVHFCCESCALCQEHAELTARGLDPSKGWIGPSTAPPPPIPPSMHR